MLSIDATRETTKEMVTEFQNLENTTVQFWMRKLTSELESIYHCIDPIPDCDHLLKNHSNVKDPYCLSLRFCLCIRNVFHSAT